MKQARYVAVPGLRIVTFEGESVVFNPSTWETHVLNPAASLLLEAVASGPRTTSDLVATLTEALDDEDRSEAAPYAERAVADFLRLRLVSLSPAALDADR